MTPIDKRDPAGLQDERYTGLGGTSEVEAEVLTGVTIRLFEEKTIKLGGE